MTRYIAAIAGVAAVAALVAATVAQANPTTRGTACWIKGAGGPYIDSAGTCSCELPNEALHCNSPQDIRAAYGVDAVGNRAARNSNSNVSGIAPSAGPQSRCAPPSNAMITTSKEIVALNAIEGSM